MAKLELIGSYEVFGEAVWSVTWNPAGTLLAACSGKKVKIFALKDGKLEEDCELKDEHERVVRSCSWSPCGKRLATCSFDSTVVIWDQAPESTWHLSTILEGHDNEVKSVVWSQCGSFLASCSRDKSVWIWGVEENGEIECCSVLSEAHGGDVKKVLWHPLQPLVFSASYDNSIKIWNEEEDDWACGSTANAHSSTVWDIAFNNDGSLLASVSDDRTMIVWNFAQKPLKMTQACCVSGIHGRTIYSVDWCKSADRIVTGCQDNCIRVFEHVDVASREGVTPVAGEVNLEVGVECKEAHEADVNCVRWNPVHEGLLASAGDDEVVKLWRYVAESE